MERGPDDIDEAELEALEEQLDPAARYVVKLLRRSLDEMRGMLRERDEQLATQTEQLARFEKLLFGRRSEKLPPIRNEVRRQLEAEELTVEGEPMPAIEPARTKERRRVARKKSEPARKRNRALRKDLPVVHEEITVRPDQLPEGYTLQDFRRVGEGEVLRRVDHVREHLVTVEYRLESLASNDGEHIVAAQAPRGVAEGGHYGSGVYAHVVVAKCADSLPLHRIEKMFARSGHPIARSTLCSLFHRSAEFLDPIYRRIFDIARSDPYVHADETGLKVLAEGKALRGWVWVVLSRQAIAYTFDKSRSGAVAQRLLAGTHGYLVSDAYSGYAAVTTPGGRTAVGCWAHTRRKFHEALASCPEAREVLEMIVELYRVEHQIAAGDKLGTELHLEARRVVSGPTVAKIEAWVKERKGRYPPKSAMGKAITYARNQRHCLRRFLDDAKLDLDNNIAERALRIMAVGRKNFMFAGHDDGAQNHAVLQTIVATCELHRVNPYEYVKDVLLRIQTHPNAGLDELLPWNWAKTVAASAA